MCDWAEGEATECAEMEWQVMWGCSRCLPLYARGACQLFFSNCGISHLLPVPTLQLPSVPQMGVLPAGSHVHLPLVVPHFRVCCASQVGSCRWHDRRVARARSLVCAQ